MWSDIIANFQKENKKSIDLKQELHLCYYVMKLLSDHYKFTIKDSDHNKKLVIHDLNSEKEISHTTFFYWWSFQRFDELIKEEEKIFNDFNDIKNKVLPALDKIKLPELKDTDDQVQKNKKIDKITASNEKITKLQNHVKSEASISNQKINSLRSFRSMYPTIDSLERLLKNIIILLENE
jgi:hypothetical protein|tara:strand:+ start:180 stop:719 length:540 start_codon:yes stop_codon:yes gene_type:complete